MTALSHMTDLLRLGLLLLRTQIHLCRREGEGDWIVSEVPMMTAVSPPTKCVLVTGPPGVGKTTLIMKVLEKLRNVHPELKVQGFYTREIRQGNERTGFEVVTVDGRTGVLASAATTSCTSARWPNVGRYKVNVTGFESLALPELQMKDDTGLFIIDEVGKMELFSASFFPAVLRVIDSNIPVLASIPIPKFGRDIPEVERIRNRADVVVHTLNKNNRNIIAEQIFSQLFSLCG